MKSTIPFLILAIILLIFTVSLSINIFPEFFFYPWLVAKGLTPYKDFFDHHGFLLYYLLAPLTADRSLLGIKAAFITIQLINLSLIWSIIRKNQSLLHSTLLGILYISLNIFIVENTIWYEQFILTGYLLIYLLSFNQSRSKQLLIGFIAALVSFIKPTAAIILLPLLLFGYWYSIITFILSWLMVMLYLWTHSTLQSFVQNVFSFNQQFSHYLLQHYSFMEDKTFLASLLFFSVVMFFFHCRYRQSSRSWFAFLIVVCSLIFLYPTYDRKHLVPFVSLLIVYISSFHFNTEIMNRLYILIIAAFTAISLIWVLPHLKQLHQRQPYPISDYQLSPDMKPFYVLGNNVEIYYTLNQLPTVYYPLLLPGFTTARPTIESKIIADINTKKVQYIIIPSSLDSEYKLLHNLHNFITHNYYFYLSTNLFQIFKKDR